MSGERKDGGAAVQKHFVEFLSPGTFVHEVSEREIDSWDADVALAMVPDIVERYGATPFAFAFKTRERGPDDLDSHVSDRSPRYYLGGQIRTIDEVRQLADPDEEILLANMESNDWDRIIVNTNSWKVTQPLGPDDVVLDYEPATRTTGEG